MPYSIVQGDLLNANTEYIVQQTNCTAIKPHGLSEMISSKWMQINPYKERRKLRNNWAIAEDRPEPGTILVYEFDIPIITGLKGVICAFAQYSHGKSHTYKDPLGFDEKYGDDSIHRIQYFNECLEAIASLHPKSVGFPYKIGCGLAGGSWIKYEKLIRNWSDSNPEIDVRIYKLGD